MSGLSDDERRELELLRQKHQTQTVEQTGKDWKAMQLLGGLAAVIGIPVGAAALSGSETGDGGTGTIFMIVGAAGLFAFIAGRIGAWWHHG